MGKKALSIDNVANAKFKLSILMASAPAVGKPELTGAWFIYGANLGKTICYDGC